MRDAQRLGSESHFIYGVLPLFVLVLVLVAIDSVFGIIT